MTEAEWQKCLDPCLSLVFIEGKSSSRKARLFACAIGRSLSPYIDDDYYSHLMQVAENYVDCLATENELRQAEELALDHKRGWAGQVACCAGDHGAWQGARLSIGCLQRVQKRKESELAKKVLDRSRSFLKCIFGNPFRTITVNYSWLTSTVIALAGQIYDSRNFSAMPILSDALQDAGCDNSDILGHCRGPGPHTRGCWVVDKPLAKV
jgi:hypothetical protein